MQTIKLLPKDLLKKNANGRVMPKSTLKLILSHSGSGPEKKRAEHPQTQTIMRARKKIVFNNPHIQPDFFITITPYHHMSFTLFKITQKIEFLSQLFIAFGFQLFQEFFVVLSKDICQPGLIISWKPITYSTIVIPEFFQTSIKRIRIEKKQH